MDQSAQGLVVAQSDLGFYAGITAVDAMLFGLAVWYTNTMLGGGYIGMWCAPSSSLGLPSLGSSEKSRKFHSISHDFARHPEKKKKIKREIKKSIWKRNIHLISHEIFIRDFGA
eukprot:7748983-Pyramimonas_sp.AAC.2